MRVLKGSICSLAALAGAVAAPGASAQLAERAPREILENRRVIIPQAERPELNLPPFYGAGGEAAKSWLTPMIIARTQAGNPPEPLDPEIADLIGSIPFPPAPDDNGASPIPAPSPFPDLSGLPVVGAPERQAPPYSGPGPRTASITVINVDRFNNVNVWTQCFTKNGANVPSLSRQDIVRGLSVLDYEPVIYLGDTDERGGMAAVWCVISASGPVTAHARTQNFDYVDFFAAARP